MITGIDLDRVEMMLLKQGRLLAALTEFVLFESAVLKHGKRASEHQSFLALEQALRELKGYDYEPMYKRWPAHSGKKGDDQST